jgi:transcriptional antiterminator RfaH
VAFWAVARTEPKRERVAIRFLELNGYRVYSPRIGERVTRRGHKTTRIVPLFHNYCFVMIEAQWHTARWCPGVNGLLMAGEAPARVADSVIAELRSREHHGLVALPAPPSPFAPGQAVRVTRGLLANRLGIYEGMSARERVSVLLGHLRASVPLADVTAAAG